MANNKKTMVENLILLGSGFKFYGSAFLDEIFFLIFSISNVEFKKIKFISLKNFLILYPIIVTLFYISEALAESNDLLHDITYKIRLVITLSALFLISACNSIMKLNFKNALISAWLVLGLNFLFGLSEIISNLLFEAFNIVYLGTAFWQTFWVGVSYNSLLIAFSTLILFANYPLSRNRFIITVLNVFIAMSHHARISSVFSYFLIFDNFKKTKTILLKKIFYLALFPLIIIQFALNFIGIDTNVIFYVSEYLLSFLYNLYRLITFQIYDIDPSRFDQIINLWSYAKENILSTLFGKGAGGSRYGLLDYISPDSSGLLRPIGLVVFVYDYGVIWLAFTYYLFFKMAWQEYRSNSMLTFKVFPFFVLIISFVTNLNECIIFWVLLFHYNLTMNQLKNEK